MYRWIGSCSSSRAVTAPTAVASLPEAARAVRPGGTIYVKDVFRHEDPLSTRQRLDLDEFDRLWSLASSPRLSEVQESLANAGCEILTAGPLPNVGTDTFVGAMFEIEGPTLGLSVLGKAFYRSFLDLPVFFGEVLARRTADSGRVSSVVARYLVVAHQTADSPELVAELRRAQADDPTSTFVLVVPATPIQHLSGWTEGESRGSSGRGR